MGWDEVPWTPDADPWDLGAPNFSQFFKPGKDANAEESKQYP